MRSGALSAGKRALAGRTLMFLLGEALVAGLLLANLFFQFSREQARVERRSQVEGGRIAREAAVFFAASEDPVAARAVARFLQSLDPARLAGPNETGETFAVYLRGMDNLPDNVYRALRDGKYEPTRKGSRLEIPMPIRLRGEEKVAGVVWIEHDRKAILASILFDDNALVLSLVYLAFFQVPLVMLAFLVPTRKREIVFEKGYLKEHAIGALKLQYRILGEILADHEREKREAPPTAPRSAPSGKVVPLHGSSRKRETGD